MIASNIRPIKFSFFLIYDWLKSFQEFTAFALGGEANGCNGTYVKAYDGDKETDNLILNKVGFQIYLLFGLAHSDWSGPNFFASILKSVQVRECYS